MECTEQSRYLSQLSTYCADNDHNALIPFTNANLVGKLLSCEPFFIKVFVIMRNM